MSNSMREERNDETGEVEEGPATASERECKVEGGVAKSEGERGS